MGDVFVLLTRAVAGAPAIALTAALAWGVLSIILSPCHLAGIPLIVGFVSGQAHLTMRRAFWLSALFGIGVLGSIALIGIVTTALGRMAGDLGGIGSYLVAGIFFLVGLHLLDVIPLPFSGPNRIPMQRKGLLAALILGLVFGIALGPCTFAFMLPILGVTFRVAATAPVYAGGLLLAYGIGHCAVLVAAGASTEMVQRYLQWNESSPGMRVTRKVCGALVLLGGLYMIYTAR